MFRQIQHALQLATEWWVCIITVFHDKIRLWQHLIASLTERPTHLWEICLYKTTWIGAIYTSLEGMGGICRSTYINWHVWRADLDTSTKAPPTDGWQSRRQLYHQQYGAHHMCSASPPFRSKDAPHRTHPHPGRQQWHRRVSEDRKHNLSHHRQNPAMGGIVDHTEGKYSGICQADLWYQR